MPVTFTIDPAQQLITCRGHGILTKVDGIGGIDEVTDRVLTAIESAKAV